MRKRILQSCILIIFLITVGCVHSQPINETPASTADAITVYPAMSVKTENAAYPVPENTGPKLIPTLNHFIVPTPESGKACVFGVLVNFATSALMSNVDIYLTRAVGEDHNQMPPILFGAIEKNGDIKGKTNNVGQFTFTNIPPGNYYLIVSMDLSPVTPKDTTTIPLLIQLRPDTITELGTIYYSGN